MEFVKARQAARNERTTDWFQKIPMLPHSLAGSHAPPLQSQKMLPMLPPLQAQKMSMLPHSTRGSGSPTRPEDPHAPPLEDAGRPEDVHAPPLVGPEDVHAPPLMLPQP